MSQKPPVLSDSEYVMEHSTDVQITEYLIPLLCDKIVNEFEFETASWDAPVFPSISKQTINDVFDYFLLGNSINYCFNNTETGEKYTYKYFDTEWSGAFGMWAALMDEYTENPDLLTEDYLKDLSVKDANEIFNRNATTDIPMLTERVECMRDVGEILSDCEGSFRNLFKHDQVSLYGSTGIVEFLSSYSSYTDTRTYNSEEIVFNKRSQLVLSMLYGKVLGTEYEFEISDMDKFTVFADYGIPAGLADNEILVYSDDLSAKIENQDLLEENSREEVEIRAATVVAGNLIQEYLQENYNVNASIPVLDYVLWKMRQDTDVNQHLTETKAY